MAKRKLSEKQLENLRKGREKRAKMLKSSSRKTTRKSPVRRKTSAKKSTAKRNPVRKDWGSSTRAWNMLWAVVDENGKPVRYFPTKKHAGYYKSDNKLRGYKIVSVIDLLKNPRRRPRKSFGSAQKKHYLVATTSRGGKMYFAGDRFTPTKSKAVAFPSKEEVRIVAEEIKDRLPNRVETLVYERS